MDKRVIQTHWDGKMKKLAGIIAGALGEENRRMKRPEPHFSFGRSFKLYDDGRLEIAGGADGLDVMAVMDVLLENEAIDRESADPASVEVATEGTDDGNAEQTGTDEGMASSPDGGNAEQGGADEGTASSIDDVSAEPAEQDIGGMGEAEHATEPVTDPAPAITDDAGSNHAETTADVSHAFTVSIPRAELPDGALANLRKMVEARGALFRKSIGTDDLGIEVTDDAVSFPWFTADEPAAEQAYRSFIMLLCDKARTANRVTARERDVENERYAMRGFLLQLGAIGKECGVMRRLLMENLRGSAAFRDRKRKGEL